MPTTINNTGVLYPDSNYQTTADGNRQLLSELVVNNSVNAPLYFGDSYNNYEVVFSNVVPVTNAVTFSARLLFNAAWQSGNYYYNGWHGIFSNNSGNQYGGNATYIPLSYPAYFINNAGGGMSGYLKVYDARNASASTWKNYEWVTHGYTWTTGGGATHEGGGFYNDASNNGLAKCDGILIYASSGNLSTGTITLYGWN